MSDHDTALQDALACVRVSPDDFDLGAEVAAFDVVGPVCESGDTFQKGTQLPPPKPGDLIAFRSAGAYGAVMSSEYNSRPLIPEVLVNGPEYAVIRPRPSYDDLIGLDRLPDWLAKE